MSPIFRHSSIGNWLERSISAARGAISLSAKARTLSRKLHGASVGREKKHARVPVAAVVAASLGVDADETGVGKKKKGVAWHALSPAERAHMVAETHEHRSETRARRRKRRLMAQKHRLESVMASDPRRQARPSHAVARATQTRAQAGASSWSLRSAAVSLAPAKSAHPPRRRAGQHSRNASRSSAASAPNGRTEPFHWGITRAFPLPPIRPEPVRAAAQSLATDEYAESYEDGYEPLRR